MAPYATIKQYIQQLPLHSTPSNPLQIRGWGWGALFSEEVPTEYSFAPRVFSPGTLVFPSP